MKNNIEKSIKGERPLLESFNLWVEASDIKCSEQDLLFLKFAWYNGASTTVLIGQINNDPSIKQKLIDDLTLFAEEYAGVSVTKN